METVAEAATVATDATVTEGSLRKSDPFGPYSYIALGVAFVYVGQRYLDHGIKQALTRLRGDDVLPETSSNLRASNSDSSSDSS